MDLKHVEPTAGRVLVRVLPGVREVDGIVLPEESKSFWAEVVKGGDGIIEPGMRVLLPALTGVVFSEGQHTYRVLFVDEIPAYVEE